jgi:hypothetical protein
MAECNCCNSSSDIACNIGSFSIEERIRYEELRNGLTGNLSVEEIPNGYTFIYPNQNNILFFQFVAK